MPNRTFHGQIMYELANDNSWPWTSKGRAILRSESTTILADVWNPNFIDFIVLSPERLARVEVELVEATARKQLVVQEHKITKESNIAAALTNLGISREDYDAVAKRLNPSSFPSV